MVNNYNDNHLFDFELQSPRAPIFPSAPMLPPIQCSPSPRPSISTTAKEVHHQKFVDLEERIRQLEGLLYDLQLENQQFQAENEQSKTHIQDLQLENQQIKAQNEQFQTHIQALQLENQRFAEENRQLQIQAQDAEPQIVHAIAEPIHGIVETHATATAIVDDIVATDAEDSELYNIFISNLANSF